jgi:hypothetical protein
VSDHFNVGNWWVITLMLEISSDHFNVGNWGVITSMLEVGA